MMRKSDDRSAFLTLELGKQSSAERRDVATLITRYAEDELHACFVLLEPYFWSRRVSPYQETALRFLLEHSTTPPFPQEKWERYKERAGVPITLETSHLLDAIVADIGSVMFVDKSGNIVAGISDATEGAHVVLRKIRDVRPLVETLQSVAPDVEYDVAELEGDP